MQRLDSHCRDSRREIAYALKELQNYKPTANIIKQHRSRRFAIGACPVKLRKHISLGCCEANKINSVMFRYATHPDEIILDFMGQAGYKPARARWYGIYRFALQTLNHQPLPAILTGQAGKDEGQCHHT